MKIEVWLVRGHGNQLEYETIKKLVDQSPYPMKFLGRLGQPQLAERVNQADVFVLPFFYEGLPLMVIEALVYDPQVICTDLPRVRPQLEEDIGACAVKFVPLPAVVNADEPVKQELPQFERHLAEAVAESLGTDGSRQGVDSSRQGPDSRPPETPGGEGLAVAGPSIASPLPDLNRVSWTGTNKKILESRNLI